MIRLPHFGPTQARLLCIAAAVGVFVLTIWASSNLRQLGGRSGDSPQGYATAARGVEYEVNVTPAVYRASTSSTTGRCNPWDVSPEAMEVVLREMIRRGWRPPRSDMALADTQPVDGQPIEALYPDQYVWVPSPRRTPPAESGDVVDVAISGEDVSEAAVTPPAVTTAAVPPPPAPPPVPASFESAAPALSDPAPPTN
jgi:hypothetical protein